MKRKIRSLVASISMAFCVGVMAPVANASLSSEINNMFDSMSNTTSPGALMDQKRGLLSGGRFSMRNKTMNVQIISALPPSFSAGCNGIDLFGGSFSFISADEFIQLLRSIASNAAGYAFQMALQTMCPSCEEIMNRLQSIVQQLNDTTLNSCEAAKSLVNLSPVTNSISTVAKGVESAAAPIAKGVGAIDDDLKAFFTKVKGGGSPVKELNKTQGGKDKLKEEELVGNIVWTTMKKANVGAWWPSGSDDFMEAIMSVTGTVITEPRDDDSDEGELRVSTVPPILDMEDLLRGGSNNRVEVYQCDTHSECLNPTKHEVTLDDFKALVSLYMAQAVEKFSTNSPLTSSEESFLKDAPGAITAQIRNLSVQGEGIGQLFVEQSSDVIAAVMARHLVLGMISTAQKAVGRSKAPNVHDVTKMLADAYARAQRQSANVGQGNEQLANLMTSYQNLNWAAEKRRLGVSQMLLGQGGHEQGAGSN